MAVVSTFLGLEIGKRAVQANQYALNITGHNVSNANTDGYTRQVPDLKTTTPYASPQVYAISPGQIGTGVTIDEIRRVRDQFLDLQYRQENTTTGMWNMKADAMAKLEGILNEPSDDSIQSLLTKFWEDWENLSKNPEVQSVRTTVQEAGQALVDTIHNMYQQLKEERDDLNASVKTKVDEINRISKQIADLNGQIQNITVSGQQANDLMDKRDLLIDQLSNLIDLRTVPDRNDMTTVVTGGRTLVQGVDYCEMAVKADSNGMYKVVWANSPDFEVNVNGGALKGILDSRGVNQLEWDTSETNIQRIESEFNDSILNYQVKTQTADDNTSVAASASKLYEYSQYSGDLIPDGALSSASFDRDDINGQILLQVVSKDPTSNNLTFQYTVDTVDRAGNHYTNTGTVTATAWASGGGGHLVLNLDLDGAAGAQALQLNIGDLTNGSSSYTVGDKFVLGLTAEKIGIADSNDGLTLNNMDVSTGGKNQLLQYYFDNHILTDNRRLSLGTFALDETTGEVFKNQVFTISFNDQPLKDGTANLDNKSDESYREIYSQPVINAYSGLVPDLMNQLNTLAKTLTEQFNAVHSQGYTLNAYPENTGINFFQDFGSDVPPDFEWAAKIELSKEVKSDVNNIAAASSPTRDSDGNRINAGDGGNALNLAAIKSKVIAVLGNSSIDDYWATVVSQTGSVSQQASSMAANQETLLDQVNTQRQSVSGVSLDEEMTNMIKFQQSYNAAARFITTIDETLNVIINSMGLVGRG
jgi:flagellar hook-associated protein 1 FlgK